MSYSNNYAHLDGNLRFCENQLKVSDIEGKMCWHPKAPSRHPFENLKKKHCTQLPAYQGNYCRGKRITIFNSWSISVKNLHIHIQSSSENFRNLVSDMQPHPNTALAQCCTKQKHPVIFVTQSITITSDGFTHRPWPRAPRVWGPAQRSFLWWLNIN